jgi:Ca-activated chloride channel family protein
MAEAGGGNFQFIERPDQLPAFFQSELGELLQVVATGVTIRLRTPGKARAALVNAFPSEHKSDGLSVSVGDLSSSAELNLVFEVAIPRGRTGSSFELGLEATWSETATDRAGSHRAVLPGLRVVDVDELERAPVDAMVQEEAALQRSDAAQREAMRLDREGRYRESREHLAHHARLLNAAPKTSRVAGSFAAMSFLAESDASEAFSESTRKQVTYEALRRSHGKPVRPAE